MTKGEKSTLDLLFLSQDKGFTRMPQINPIHEAFYIESMLINTRTAISALTEANFLLALVDGNDDIEAYVQDEILNKIQEIIIHGAALSRYFWPSRKEIDIHRLRGERLRTAFKMDDHSPLRNRSLRDHLEHFDEKLDKHLTQEPMGYFFPKYVGPAPSDNEPPHHLFRAYFTDTGVFQILYKKYELEPLVNEIYRLSDLLEDCSKSGCFTATTANQQSLDADVIGDQ